LASGLGWDDPIVSALFNQAQAECRSTESIALTGEYNADDARPPLLTSTMNRWYRQHIASTRGPALQEVRNTFSAIDLGKGQRAFLIESEKDRIERENFQQIAKERDQYFSSKYVQDKSKELVEARDAYEQMKSDNGGDDANEWSAFTYILILTLLAIPELPLNFQSLLSFFSTVPAIAAVLALVIAIGIAFSSHIIGMTVKQWGELFGGHAQRRDKMRAARFLALGIMFFTIAMGLVYFPRSSLFRAALDRKIVLGELITFSDYMGLLVSVGGNVLIWLIGVGVAYVAHSHIPGFGAKQRLLSKLQKEVGGTYEKELQHRKNQHISRAQKDLSNITQLESRQLKNRPDYVAARSLFEEFRKTDNIVLAILEEYRGRLVEYSRTNGNKLTFLLDDINSITEDKQVKIDSSAYLQMKLRLPYA
jgi:hypothetical protein